MSIHDPGSAGISGSAGIPAGKSARDGGAPSSEIGDTPGSAGIPAGPKGWYSRGYLPHLDQPGLLQSISFRLHDAVPTHVVEQWKHELHWREGISDRDPLAVTLRRRIAEYEDAGHGACSLRDERIAALIENTFLHFDGQRYRLIAWCVMPNHVHVLIETWPGYPLDTVLHSWKSFTAQQANKVLERTGPFWAREYYDRFIRDDRHFELAVAYIEQNPVKAGLVASAEAWPFGSAARKESS
jgi:REP element-mobilizing transposase RayT